MMHLKKLETQKQNKPNISRRKEIIKIRAEINEIETKKIIQKINKNEMLVFWKDKQNRQNFLTRLRKEGPNE